MIKDPAAFLVDILTGFSKFDEPRKEKDRVTGVKIAGDKATATVIHIVKGKETKKPISFVKISNSWRMIPKIESPSDEEDKTAKKPDFKTTAIARATSKSCSRTTRLSREEVQGQDHRGGRRR